MHLLEEKKPFSESLMWDLQREYYNEEGIEAWRSGEVPHYLTSNPVVGRTYAELVLAILRDLAHKGQVSEPVYLLELGAGHGRLCYHFFKHFEKYYTHSNVSLPPFCYVLSDFAESNLKFWDGQEQLQEYKDKGWLDSCYFDAKTGEKLELRHANKTIDKGSLKQPLLVVANYFFDSLPQDLFLIGKDVVSSCQLSLYTAEEKTGQGITEQIDDLQFGFDYTLESFPVYEEEPVFDAILEYYSKHLEGSHLLFPSTGLQCLERLRTLSTEGLFLITADKGEHHLKKLDNQEEPIPVTHGSFSLIVNYHAFIQYAQRKGGWSLFSNHHPPSLLLGCLFLTKDDGYLETKQAYTRFVDDFGPDDYFGLKKLIESKAEDLNAGEIISCLRLSAYDARIFLQLFPHLSRLLPDVTGRERDNLFMIVPFIWSTYYHIGEPDDLAFELGELLLSLLFYQEAALYFEKSLQLYGRNGTTLYKLAVCHCLSGAFRWARPLIAELLELDAENKTLLALIEKYEEDLKLKLE